MTVSIEKANEAFEYYKHQISTVKGSSHLTQSGKEAALKEIDGKIDAQRAYWKEEVAAEKKRITDEVEALKPSTVNREFSAETIAVLNYTAKTILSRIAAEGKQLQNFRDLMLDIVDNGNDMTRQAFLDSYHEIMAAAERFDHAGKAHVDDYYYRAKGHMKTPEQSAYEAALTEATSLNISIDTKLIAVEKNTTTLKEMYSIILYGSDNGPKDYWGR